MHRCLTCPNWRQRFDGISGECHAFPLVREGDDDSMPRVEIHIPHGFPWPVGQVVTAADYGCLLHPDNERIEKSYDRKPLPPPVAELDI